MARMEELETTPSTAVKYVATATTTTDVGGADLNPNESSQPPSSGAAAARPSASASGFGSHDRRDPSLFRGDAPGIFTNQRSAPGIGNNSHHLGKASTTVDFTESSYERERVHYRDREREHHHEGRLATPKMDFPRFDGENPKVWEQECEMYFEIYQVQDSFRTRYAALNFRGTAALWLPNVQAQRRIEDWGEMCRLVHANFGKNRYIKYRRQMRGLKQTCTVTDYCEKFEILRNQLLLYNPALDEAFFVEEFLHGLRDDIRSAIHLHCPQDLDTASLLALMQEEDLENKKSLSLSNEPKHHYKFSGRPSSSYSSDRNVEKQSGRIEGSKKPDTTKWENRLDALKAYRRSKGLCFTCGEKYSKSHKCPEKIPLHVIEELMEILPISDAADDDFSDGGSDPDDLMMIAATITPNEAKKKHTIRLQGTVGKHSILILIDSGSVASFVSTKMAEQLKCATHTMPNRQFTVADGHPVQCSQFVPHFEWSVQGHTFVHSVHVLNIGCYDMIGCRLAG